MKFLLGFAFIASSALSAHADEPIKSDPSWCSSPESWPTPNWGNPDLVPDGGLVRVGTRIFRTCTSPHNPDGWRVIRLALNPALIPETLNRHAWLTLSVSDIQPRGEWLPAMLRDRIAVGTRVFGGATYREYRHWEHVEVEHSIRMFVYEPGLNPGLVAQPDHAISCRDRSRRNGAPVTCFVFVFHEDIRASIMMIGDGEGFPPLPRHEFPRIARDMQEVLHIADVTARLSSLESKLPRFD